MLLRILPQERRPQPRGLWLNGVIPDNESITENEYMEDMENEE